MSNKQRMFKSLLSRDTDKKEPEKNSDIAAESSGQSQAAVKETTASLSLELSLGELLAQEIAKGHLNAALNLEKHNQVRVEPSNSAKRVTHPFASHRIH